MTRFYIAGSLARAALVKELADLLTAAGMTHTYDWTRFDEQNVTPDEDRPAVASAEIEGVVSADYVFVIHTPNRAARGTHAELGAALAAKKKVVLLVEMPDGDYTNMSQALAADGHVCVFYDHPAVRQLFVKTFTAEKLTQAVQAIVRHDSMDWGNFHGLKRLPCEDIPELLLGAPMGMYHCNGCGAMQMAGLPHLPPLNWEKTTGALWLFGYDMSNPGWLKDLHSYPADKLASIIESAPLEDEGGDTLQGDPDWHG